MPKSWFKMQARENSEVADISIYNEIGGFGVTVQDFARDLEALGAPDTLRISISSDGGDISTGYAIFNMLSRHTARKVVRVDGLAASMASVILMAGDERIVPKNAMVMIHNPWGSAWGEGEQLIAFGEALVKMKENIIESYMDVTGLSKKEIAAMMDKETWLNAREAKKLGFATKVAEPTQMVAQAYDIAKFSNVPAAFGRKLKESAMRVNKSRKQAARNEADDDGDFEGMAPKTEAEIRAELLAKHKEVRAACKLAGLPDLADGFIDEDLSVSEVLAKLEEARKAADEAKAKGKGKTAADDVSARHNPNAREGVARTVNPSKIYDNWNSRKSA